MSSFIKESGLVRRVYKKSFCSILDNKSSLSLLKCSDYRVEDLIAAC